jgi:signal transduction histidine kinase
VAGPVEPPLGTPYLIVAASLLALWALLTFGLAINDSFGVSLPDLAHVLQVGSFMVAVAVGGLALSRWYLTSDLPAMWIGVALILYGVVRLGVVELLPWVVTSTSFDEVGGWVRPAAQITVALLLLVAVTMPAVSAKASGPRVILLALASVAGFAVLFYAWPALATLVDGAEPTFPRTYTEVNTVGLMPALLAVLGAAYTWRGQRRRRWLFTWLGLGLLTFALADLARVMAPPPVESGLLAKEVLRFAGLIAVLNGGIREILYTYRDSSTRLAKSEYTALTAQERIKAGQAQAEERAHEARSALAAIEGATRTLEHYRDRLPAETQEALSTAISGEIRRLQRLVSAEDSPSDVAPFSLAESLAPLVATERARGVDIDVDVAGDLDVIGRAGAVEQVIQTLFDNARRYARGTPLTVRAHREQDWVVLRVEDCGPGVAPDQREAIFRRGVRGDASQHVPGSGLGLYVAANLMQEQSGELWVDERAGGGASFALALPVAPSGEDDTVNSLEQHDEITDLGGLRTVRRRD